MLWSEGMFLAPHHFQQRDRQAAAEVRARLDLATPFAAGVAALTFNTAELAQGLVSLSRCEALLPDGTWIRLPEKDDPPPARALGAGVAHRPVGVYLAVREEGAGRLGIQRGEAAGAAAARYREVEVEVEDELGTAEARRVAMGRLALALHLDGEESAGWVRLKVAEVVRNPVGTFVLNPDFVPPVLRLAAAPRVVDLLREVHAQLVAKAASLAQSRKGKGRAAGVFTAHDLYSFWFLYALDGAIARLGHVLSLDRLHPERAYDVLLELAGHLTTFDEAPDPAGLPLYRQDDPLASFAGLAAELRKRLEIVLPKGFVEIPLERQDPTRWRGRLSGDASLRNAEFFLCLVGHPPLGLRPEDVPGRIKVCSADDADSVIGLSMSGVEVVALPRPPAGVPARADAWYYRFRRSGMYWDHIQSEGSLVVHIPEALAAFTPELVAVKEG